MFKENLREVKIILRTVFENGKSLRDQDFYDDKLTINYGSIQYADEDWYEGIVKNITGTNIPKDYDDRLGYYIEIRVSEMDFDESELNFHFENIRLINSSFNFSYETMTLN